MSSEPATKIPEKPPDGGRVRIAPEAEWVFDTPFVVPPEIARTKTLNWDEKALFSLVMDFCDRDTGLIVVSPEELGKECGMDPEKVLSVLERLANANMLSWEEPPDKKLNFQLLPIEGWGRTGTKKEDENEG